MDILYCIPCFFMNIAKNLLMLILVTIAWRAYKIIYGRKDKRPVKQTELVLVTGSSAGIGLAVCKHLYELGYSVVATYNNENEVGVSELESLAKHSKNNSAKKQFIVYKLDVRNEQSIKNTHKLITDLIEQNQYKLYAVINNAGIGSLQPFAWIKRNHMRDIVDTNLMGTLMVARQFIPLLIKSKGRLINVSSGLGYFPGPNYLTYGITKASLIYFTRALNMELAKEYGVKTICVAPANFIKQTEICLGNIEHVENCWSEMDETEKKLYKKEYEKHCKWSKSLDNIVKDHHKAQRASQAKRTFKTGSSSSSHDSMMGTISKIIGAVKGTNKVMTLEESGLLDCFEDALRLENPPEHILAGDNFFNLVAGSIFTSLPMSCSNWLGNVVAPSLYK